jgi:putative sterol carrier protein
MAVFGTLAMYQELARLLQEDPGWAERGKPITCTMSFRYDEPVGKQFFLRFNRGTVEEVREIGLDADEASDYVFAGPPDVWRKVFANEIPPSLAVMGGKLRVTGRKSWLLENMVPFKQVLDTFKKVEIEEG